MRTDKKMPRARILRTEATTVTHGTETLSFRVTTSILALVGTCLATGLTVVRAQQAPPAAIAAPGAVAVMTVHAVGAQIYQCQADAAGKPAWQFREPVASLMIDGRTVGRHFAGPARELADGSFIAGKVVGHASGSTSNDIPWLKLEGSAGRGQFANVTVIQRINTKGGGLAGACDNAGELTAVPYASDYVFLAKSD